MLTGLIILVDGIVRPPDFEFEEVPSQIRGYSRYWPYFQRCIGAINGKYILVVFLFCKYIDSLKVIL